MINSEANLIIELWDQIRDALPNNRRSEIAVGMIKSFIDFGFEKEDIVDITDEDDILAAAFNEFFDDGYDGYEGEEVTDEPW